MKKGLLIVFAFAIAIATVPMFAAFEAHIINVTAQIENALSVNTDPIEFGTVFPQEALDREINISLSGSFREEGRVDDVEYVIRQKPKCQLNAEYTGEPLSEFGRVTEDGDVFICEDGENYHILPVLCPFLSKHEITAEDSENDSDGINAFHGPIFGWDLGDTLDTQVAGRLAKSDDDYDDTWNIDFRVPCFDGHCAQDWADFVIANNPEATPEDYILPTELEHDLFGCDLWIEVNGISESNQPNPEPRHISLENKTDTWQVIPDDQTWGDIDYNHNDTSFKGTVTGKGLTPNAPYQITLNGPGTCTLTDNGLAGVGPTLFDSGYWNGGPNLDASCGNPGEGVYNMSLQNGGQYTVMTDGNGDFTHNFDLALPAGNYSGIKVLVKKMLEPFVSPWADFGLGYPTFNLYETAPISFTILP